jgi:hypothetical protein
MLFVLLLPGLHKHDRSTCSTGRVLVAWHSTDLDARVLRIVLVGRPPVVTYTVLTQTA